jgi:hypothetical protein
MSAAQHAATGQWHPIVVRAACGGRLAANSTGEGHEAFEDRTRPCHRRRPHGTLGSRHLPPARQYGVILLDGKGRCCFANARASSIAGDNDGLVLDETGVAAAVWSETLRLRRAIAAAAADANGRDLKFAAAPPVTAPAADRNRNAGPTIRSCDCWRKHAARCTVRPGDGCAAAGGPAASCRHFRTDASRKRDCRHAPISTTSPLRCSLAAVPCAITSRTCSKRPGCAIRPDLSP